MNLMSRRFSGAVAVVSVVLSTSAAANAPAGRYTTANGTVTDTKTKLTWQQAVPSAMYAWADAKTYCRNLSLSGTGWRLPTMKELQTTIDYSQSTGPFVDRNAFPATPPAYFWSSTPFPGVQPPVAALAVNITYGSTSTLDLTATVAVRCVR